MIIDMRPSFIRYSGATLGELKAFHQCCALRRRGLSTTGTCRFETSTWLRVVISGQARLTPAKVAPPRDRFWLSSPARPLPSPRTHETGIVARRFAVTLFERAQSGLPILRYRDVFL